MSASDLTSVAFLYKRAYTDKQTGDLAMRNHPLMKMMRKEGGFKGTAFFYPIRYGNPQGVSNVFSTAQTNAASSKGVQLQADRKKKYGVITLDGEAIAAAENKGAFLNLVTTETDGVLEEMGDHSAFELFRDGIGIRGQRSSESTDVTTLTTADDARNFKVGMVVGASANADLSSPRTGTTAITSVDEDAGTIGLDTSAITSYADSDYLFVSGTANACVEGLASLFPLTAPAASESFRGIDRSVDARRLAGVRVDDTATAIWENAGLVGVKIGQVGQMGRVVVLNSTKFHEVARLLNAKITYDGGGVSATAGFEGFNIATNGGTLRAISDPDCPINRGYVLNLSTLYIKHLRALPHIIMDDGVRSLRQTSDDGIEARTRQWWNVICTKPGANGVFSIAA